MRAIAHFFLLESYGDLMADHCSDKAMAMALESHCPPAKPWRWLSEAIAPF